VREVAPLKLGKDVSTSVLAVTVTAPAKHQAEARAALDRLSRQYQQQQQRALRQMPNAMPPQGGWILIQEVPKPKGAARALILGGLAGLLLGAGASCEDTSSAGSGYESAFSY
jgi:type II secretory pathway pseudopilin PulG